jgi:hypothetical protein
MEGRIRTASPAGGSRRTHREEWIEVIQMNRIDNEPRSSWRWYHDIAWAAIVIAVLGAVYLVAEVMY